MTDQNGQTPHETQPPQQPSSPWASAAPSPSAPYRHRGGGVTAGVVLIAIGAIFLAGQFVPGVAWWNLWPLLVVLGGVVQMFTPHHDEAWTFLRLLDGVGTVIVGVVLLGNTLGIVSWSVWWMFITLWPALLIALGISILGRGLHQTWMRAVAMLLVWATLAYAVATALTGTAGLAPLPPLAHISSGQAYSFSEPVRDAATGSLAFTGAAGDIRIHSGDQLVSAHGTTPFGTPEFAVTREGTKANVAVTLGTSDRTVVAPGFATGDADITLARPVIWDAVIEAGASSLDADLSDMQFSHLTLKTGVSDATLKLGEVPPAMNSSDIEVKSGISDVKILVPADAAVRVNTHNGLASTSFDPRFTQRQPGVWETPDIANSSQVINISVESGISSVSVRTY